MLEKDFLDLISHDCDDKDFLEDLALRAKYATLKRFGRVKGAYIPLYISNYCDNSCTYCGFNKNNNISRKILTLQEIKNELKAIYDKGFRTILFVSGESNSDKLKKYLIDAVSLAKQQGFASIAVELGSLDEKTCKGLVENGAESFVLYQETYHEDTYKRVHPAGVKKDYEFRLNSIDNAIQCGFKRVTLGFLTGLYDAEYEAKMLYKHIKKLKKKYWSTEICISIPRITDAEGVSSVEYKVSDKKYLQILMALRLAFEDVPILISTRENAIFRDGLTDICATHLSVESKTSPGGYCETDESHLEQFKTSDNRDLNTIKNKLKQLNYDIYFKDWDISLQN